jgi:uncharacterized protein YegJ (DUF2314 family)
MSIRKGRVIGFIDGVAQNAATPKTFSIPSEIEKHHLKPGQYVKIGFRTDALGGPSTERMWVKVIAWDGKTGRGEVNNDPAVVDLKFGDPVKFDSKHILDIYEG